MYTSIQIFAALWASLALAEFPPEFQKCDRNSADLQPCLSKAVGDALKQLKDPKGGLPSIEPIQFDKILVTATREDANFTGTLTNYQAHGFATSDFEIYANMDFATNTFVLDLAYPKLEHFSNCEFVGTLKGRSITGKGSGGCIGEKEKISITFLLEEYTKDGKSYYKTSNTEFFILGESVTCNFDKFDGDITAEDLTKLVNANVELYIGELTDEVEFAFGVLAHSYFDLILDNASIDEIFGNASSA